MSTLYTLGKWAVYSAEKFNGYDTIQVSSTDSVSSVQLALSRAGTIDFSSKLALRSAEIYGTSGRDDITSGRGEDTLWGLSGKDILSGDYGDDLLFGDEYNAQSLGDDVLSGGSGNDILVGGAGRDRLYGGDGDDLFLIANKWPGLDTFSGGAGLDIVVISDEFKLGFTEVHFSSLILNSAASVEYFLLDPGSGIKLLGSDDDNLFDLSGTTVGHTGSGGLNNPVEFDLGRGSDTFLGGDGREIVRLQDGNDRVELGDGEDTLILVDGTIAGGTFNGGGGRDLIIFQLTEPGAELVFHRLDLSSGSGFEGAKFGADTLYGTSEGDVWDMTGMVYQQFVPETGYYVNKIDLRAGDDLFKGASNQDNISGGEGNDTLYGNDGGDQLAAGTGIDALYGGDGDDHLYFDDWQAGDKFDAGRGSNALDIGRELAPGGTIATVTYDSIRWFATANINQLAVLGDIRILASAAADQIDFSYLSRLRMESTMQLLEGNDRYTGSADGNNVDGGAGNDSLYGGAGSDTLIGGVGDDLMVGGEGGDTYEINSAGDVVVETGTQGIDTIITTFATWTISGPFEGVQAEGPGGLIGIGNEKANVLTGGDGNDLLKGLDGKDTLTGAGQDTLVGGDKSDVYYVDDSSVTIVELDKQGSDTIVTRAASWTLSGSVENLSMWGDGDALGVGSAKANYMRASGSGHTTLQGMGGNDTLDADHADVRLEGGKGDDFYVITDGQGEIVELAHGGNDRVEVYFTGSPGQPDDPADRTYVIPDFVEQLYLHTSYRNYSDGTSFSAIGIGNARDNVIFGSNGNDTLYGMDGNDRLDGGGDGNDSLLGGSGNDTLVAYHGATDTLMGGDGDDTYLLLSGVSQAPNVAVEEVNGGFDTIEIVATYFDLGYFANVEAIKNTYMSGSGTKVLGSRTYGNDLDNLVTTGGGADTLGGGDGHDTLIGGAGSDDFMFGSSTYGRILAESSDTVIDFVHGVDRIVLNRSWSFPNLYHSGPLYADEFKEIRPGATVDDSDRLIYDRSTGNLYFDQDGSGAAERILVLVLANHAQLTASDILMSF